MEVGKNSQAALQPVIIRLRLADIKSLDRERP
jgi:hypothetical protein